MAILDYFLKGEQKRNYGLFAYLVRIAQTDNVITEGEEKLLKRTALILGISEAKYKEIVKNPEAYSLDTPYSYEERIERLYRLTQMIYADGNADFHEVNILKKAIVALGFPTDNVDKIASEAVHLVMNNNELEEFSKAIKNVNAD
jgi:uncharacterized tellurite resistance protein B-like protein